MGSSDGISLCFGKTRFLILVLSVICLTFSMANSLGLNFTVICMNDVYEKFDNSTGEIHWLQSPTHVNALFSAIAIGCLIGTIPFSLLVSRFGIGFTIALYGLVSSLSTLATPLAVHLGFGAVFICRILQGTATSLSYPATGMIGTQWAAPKNAGFFIAILSTHVQFCSIFTMPLAGELCESSLGWRSLYYIQGIIASVSFIVFYLFYRDNPATHKWVGREELEKIQDGRTHNQTDRVIPYKAIAMDPCVIAIWCSSIGGTLGFQIFLLYGPSYMNKVLKIDVKSTGFVTALPYVLSVIMKFAAGHVSDRLRFIRDKYRMVFFASFSQGIMGICFIILSQSSSAFWGQFFYTAAIVASGVNSVGVIKCSSVYCRQHVHFVMAVVSFILCLIVLFIPVAVDFVCPNNTPDEVMPAEIVPPVACIIEGKEVMAVKCNTSVY
ncbi:unnamed protein product [Auanema sp. JU1783]|nr:unnamed protein product [Auanema sp. JU1783]